MQCAASHDFILSGTTLVSVVDENSTETDCTYMTFKGCFERFFPAQRGHRSERTNLSVKP